MASKNLYIPSKVWLSVKDFTAQFPQTKLPIAILLADAALPGPTIQPWSTGTIASPSGVSMDEYTYDKKISTYRDIVKSALSPDSPLSIDFYISDFITSEKNITYPWLGDINMPKFSFGISSTCSNIMLRTLFLSYLSMLKMDFLGMKFSAEGSSQVIPDYTNVMLSKDQTWLCYKVYRDQIIDYLINNGFKYFEIKTQDTWLPFNEIYGISDISQVPANTISYIVVNQPPPVDSSIKWDNVDFWSALFNDKVGLSILNAVAHNMPVSIKTTVTNWKDPNLYLAQATTTEDKNKITYSYTYVWQDFEIQIDTKNSIIVKYNRGTDTQDIVVKKTSAFMDILKGVGFLAAFAVITSGIGAALGQESIFGAGAAAPTGAVSTVTPSAIPSGITLQTGLPSAWQASFTGLPTIAGEIPSAGVSAAEAAATAGGAAAASSSTVFSQLATQLPKVGAVVATAGIGLWSEEQKAKIQQAMLNSGLPSNYSQYIPDGKLSDGSYVYSKQGNIFGLSYMNFALIAGIGILAVIILKK